MNTKFEQTLSFQPEPPGTKTLVTSNSGAAARRMLPARWR
jgi:hypothetical protein